MNFKVSKKAIKLIQKRLYRPPIAITIMLIIFFLGTQNISDFIPVALIVLSIAVFTFFTNKRMIDSEIKMIKNQILTINEDGLSINNIDLNLMVPWDKIDTIKIKNRKNRLKEIKIFTNLRGFDLSHFENLESINMELKKYLDDSKWK